MSHISLREADTVDQQISSIAALRRAVDRCGLVFKQDQTRFHNWATDHGRLVGDWPLPEGYTSVEELENSCKHAIGLDTSKMKHVTNLDKYEIGVILSKKFPGTYSLAYDFYGGAIDAKAGKGLSKLQRYYHMEAARLSAQAYGYTYSEVDVGNGNYDVRIDTTAVLGY